MPCAGSRSRAPRQPRCSVASIRWRKPMAISRRDVIQSGLVAGAAIVGAKAVANAQPAPAPTPAPPAKPGKYQGVVVPNGATLPVKTVGNVKVFHLIAGAFTHTIAPGLDIEA